MHLPRYPLTLREPLGLTYPVPPSSTRFGQAVPSLGLYRDGREFDRSLLDRIAREGEEERDSMRILPYALQGCV